MHQFLWNGFYLCLTAIPAGIYLLKVNNRNRTRCEICSKLTIKIPERRHWHRSGIFIVNFEHFTPCSSVSIVNFEHVITGCNCFSWIFCRTLLQSCYSKMISPSLTKGEFLFEILGNAVNLHYESLPLFISTLKFAFFGMSQGLRKGFYCILEAHLWKV